MRKTISSLGASAMLMAASVSTVFAVGEKVEKIELKAGTGSQFAGIEKLTVPAIVSGLIRLLVIGAAVLFFVWLVLGGIRWIMSGGDKAKTEEARNQITAALVGLVVVFSAWAIAQLIKTLFDFDIFTLTINPLGT